MVDDGEGWEFYSERFSAAAKDRSCNECSRTIYVGEVYRAAVGKFDGYLNSYATCAHCLVAAEWLNAACNGYLFDAVLDDLREHATDSPQYDSPALRALIDGMERGWDDGLAPLPDVDLVRASVPPAPSPAPAQGGGGSG